MSYFKAKMHQFDFDWGSAPDAAGGAHSAPADPLNGFERVLLLREGKGMGRKVRGKGKKRKIWGGERGEGREEEVAS